MKKTIISDCRSYRYQLWREWIGGTGYAMFIGLNPSTADESADDPTIRRCVAFAKSWGYSALCMTNLFAFRTVSPEFMKCAPDPVGPNNDKHLLQCAIEASVIVAAWGNHGGYLDRDIDVLNLLPETYFLRLTKQAFPQHPLYLPGNLRPEARYVIARKRKSRLSQNPPK
jgi:hypothetical protein